MVFQFITVEVSLNDQLLEVVIPIQYISFRTELIEETDEV